MFVTSLFTSWIELKVLNIAVLFSLSSLVVSDVIELYRTVFDLLTSAYKWLFVNVNYIDGSLIVFVTITFRRIIDNTVYKLFKLSSACFNCPLTHEAPTVWWFRPHGLHLRGVVFLFQTVSVIVISTTLNALEREVIICFSTAICHTGNSIYTAHSHSSIEEAYF